MTERLVVIGGVAGGATAAAKAKRVNPGLQVDMFEKGDRVSYGACGLPYYIGGEIESEEKLIIRTPRQFESQGIRVHLGAEVMDIDADAREILVYNRQTGREERYSFDSLVIATGALPVKPPIPGTGLEGVYTLRSFDDGVKIKRELESRRIRRAVIVGGGFIGIEMAEAFSNWDVDVMILKESRGIFRDFGEETSKIVKACLTKHGIIIQEGCEVEAVLGTGRVEAVLVNGERVETDLVLISKGVRPNVSLASQAGIVLGPYGGISTNERVETSIKGIFACGDCAETRHLLTGEPYYQPLGTTANKLGRVAGTNAAGGNAYFKGVLGTTMIKVFELGVARTGLTEAELDSRGVAYETTVIAARDRAHYYPGGGRFTVRLIWDINTGRLLGGSMVGPGPSVLRIDALAIAIYDGMVVDDLARQDLAYSPPYSPVWDPLLIAANKSVRD